MSNIKTIVRGASEVFVPIKNHPEYEISNTGKIRNIIARKGTKIGKVLNIKPNKTGHIRVCLRTNKQEYWYLVHVLVVKMFIGEAPSKKHEVAHRDGNAGNNRVENLRWATRAENEADKIIHGRTNRGERHGHSKLTTQDVMAIRKLRTEGMIYRLIADKFSINRKTANDICNQKRWRHI